MLKKVCQRLINHALLLLVFSSYSLNLMWPTRENYKIVHITTQFVFLFSPCCVGILLNILGVIYEEQVLSNAHVPCRRNLDRVYNYRAKSILPRGNFPVDVIMFLKEIPYQRDT